MNDPSTKKIWSLLEGVNDPEIPVLSIVDLGIVRDVKMEEEGIVVIVTPTYSGCPAMDVIRIHIKMALLENGYETVRIRTILSPAWTTDWMSEKGKDQLRAYGIAAPAGGQPIRHPGLFQREEQVPCPRCLSLNTSLISQFGSTACKALYRCEECKEPFDYFKCH